METKSTKKPAKTSKKTIKSKSVSRNSKSTAQKPKKYPIKFRVREETPAQKALRELNEKIEARK